MNTQASAKRSEERGSAMIIAILVMVILTLLGVSFLLMAETENRIAENERLAAQALYFAETGARQVRVWFDRPYNTGNVANPPLTIIDRTLRLIDADGDPSTAPVLQDGSISHPRYKQGVDPDGDGNDNVFDRPYRDALVDTLLGTEDGPDMRIAASANNTTKTWLNNFSNQLVVNYPAAGAGIRARITQIDVYAPPYVQKGSAWIRYGVATVKVFAQIVRVSGTTEQVLAERMVKAVLNETPYPGPYGPLHSCENLNFNGEFITYWGAVSAVDATDFPNNHLKAPPSLARDLPVSQRFDKLMYSQNAGQTANFNAYKAAIESMTIDDPWLRFLGGGVVNNSPTCGGAMGSNSNQTCPFAWNIGTETLGARDGQVTHHSGGSTEGSHSNILQNMPIVTCPEFDYETWKSIATSGGNNVRYYTWSSGTSFQENGEGTPQTFRDITDSPSGAAGFYFFDTKDGVAPHDDDGDGDYDNLTPEIKMTGGTWGARGFVYLNADDFQSRGISGRTVTFNAPGEPFQDLDNDGKWDPGEAWINLRYPTTLAGSFVADAADALGGSVMRNDQGPNVTGTANLWGILYNNGYWDSTGTATYYGSVITKQGAGVAAPSAGTPQLYWDESIVKKWPPDSWDLPRVIITRWVTDL